jgi:hypothetical protein
MSYKEIVTKTELIEKITDIKEDNAVKQIINLNIIEVINNNLTKLLEMNNNLKVFLEINGFSIKVDDINKIISKNISLEEIIYNDSDLEINDSIEFNELD